MIANNTLPASLPPDIMVSFPKFPMHKESFHPFVGPEKKSDEVNGLERKWVSKEPYNIIFNPQNGAKGKDRTNLI